MRERCPAFLIEDFEAAVNESSETVRRLYDIASESPSIDLTTLAEWQAAQQAIQWQLKARTALEQTGLPLPPEALATAERAQADLIRLRISREISE